MGPDDLLISSLVVNNVVYRSPYPRLTGKELEIGPAKINTLGPGIYEIYFHVIDESKKLCMRSGGSYEHEDDIKPWMIEHNELLGYFPLRRSDDV